eukprot:389600_1
MDIEASISVILVENSQFIDCKDVSDGSPAFGAIVTIKGLSMVCTHLSHSLFEGNECKPGASVFLADYAPILEVSHSNFTNNSAINSGGIFAIAEECRDISQVIVIFLAVIIQILSFILMVCVALMNLMNLARLNYIIFSFSNLVSNVTLLCMFGQHIHALGQQLYTYELDALSHSIHDGSINSGELTVELTKPTQRIELTSIHEQTQSSSTTSMDTLPSKGTRRPQIIKNKLLTKTIQNMTGALIAFISSNLMSILSIYRMNNKRLWIIHLMFITMDQTINVLCLYQRQKQSRSCYNKHCATLHGCIGKMLIGNPSKQDYKCNETSYTQSVNMVPQEHSIRPYSTTSTLSTLTESSARTTPHGLPHLQLRPDHVSEMESSETSSFPHLWPDGE